MRSDLERVRKRVAGQVLDDLRLQLAHPLERLGLGDEVDALHQRVGGELDPDGVDLRLARRLGARRLGAEVDLGQELLFLVVTERLRPGAEGDEQPKQEHPDQDGHRRCDRGREVRAERPDSEQGLNCLIRSRSLRAARRGRAYRPRARSRADASCPPSRGRG